MTLANWIHPLLFRGGAEWSPLDLPNLWAWFDANQIEGLDDGDPVATWEDLGPNGYDVVQAAAPSQPSYRIDVVNGLPVVRFAGDILINNAVVTPGNLITIYAVVLTTSFITWKHIVNCQQAVNNWNFAFMINNVAQLVKSFTDAPGSWRNFQSIGDFQAATFHLCVGAYDMTDQLVALDGIDETLGYGQVPVASTNLVVGGNIWQGAESWAGDIPEIIICNTAPLSVGADALARNYMLNKYGIATPFADYLVYDRFSDANNITLPNHTPNKNAVGTPWRHLRDFGIGGTPAWKIWGNKSVDPGVGNSNQYIVIDSGVADFEIEVDYVPDAGWIPWTIFRSEGLEARHCWFFMFHGGTNQWRLYEYDAAYVVRNSVGGVAPAGPITVKIVCNGNDIDCYVDDVLKCSFTSALFNDQTWHGFGANTPRDNYGTADNFRITGPSP